jgi:hypothetical protein
LAEALVTALSAANVLTGLATALIILAILVATVYSRAVRDARAAIDRLHESGAAAVADTLAESLATTLRRPIEHVQAQLADATDKLDSLVGAPGAPNPGQDEPAGR